MQYSAMMRGDVTIVIQELRGALANDSKSTVVIGPNDTIFIERRYSAAKIAVVCIGLFPIGLLALLALKRVVRGTVAVSDNGNGTVTLRMSGTLYTASLTAIDGVIRKSGAVVKSRRLGDLVARPLTCFVVVGAAATAYASQSLGPFQVVWSLIVLWPIGFALLAGPAAIFVDVCSGFEPSSMVSGASPCAPRLPWSAGGG